jgi:hypothetical protein
MRRRTRWPCAGCNWDVRLVFDGICVDGELQKYGGSLGTVAPGLPSTLARILTVPILSRPVAARWRNRWSPTASQQAMLDLVKSTLREVVER